MTDIQIAIPTFKRVEIFRTRILAYLQRTNFPLANVTLFVSVGGEAESYRKEFGDLFRIVECPRGVAATRNFIATYYEEGTKVVQFDDDVESVREKITEQDTREVDDLVSVCEEGFNACRLVGAEIWGVYPVKNPFFMKHKTTFDLKRINACFFGLIINHDKDLLVTLDVKEEIERTLIYWHKQGVIVRLNWITQWNNYWTLAGGINASTGRSNEKEEEEVKELLRRYPAYCTRAKKKSGHPEVKLKRL